MNIKAISIFAVLGLTGCASVINDKTHPIRFDAKQVDGTAVQGAQCTATNDKSHVSFRSGETVQVRRSAKNLELRCTSPGLAEATGTAVSRANAATWGNLIVGGVIGAVVDHSNGKAYTYPTWVQLVFGESRTYDRRDDEEGRPVVGTVTGVTPEPVAMAAAAPASTTQPQYQAPQQQAPQAAAAPQPAAQGATGWRAWGTPTTPNPPKALYRCQQSDGTQVVTETAAAGCTVITQ